MKKKRSISYTLMLVSVMAMSLLLTACGGTGGTDYSKWTYDQYAETDIDWDKDVSYQFVLREEGNSSTYAAVYPGIMNLKKDGSAVMFEPSAVAGEPVNQFEPLEGYENEKVIAIYYGYWTEKDGVITINVKYNNDMEYQVYTVEKNDTLMTIAVTMAYPGGDVPVGSEMDCNNTIQYASWKDYCARVNTMDWFNSLNEE